MTEDEREDLICEKATEILAAMQGAGAAALAKISLEQAASLVGQKVGYRVVGLVVPVEITNVKPAYSNFLFEISPVGGSGSKWVVADSLQLGA